jgi:hypothetical protein
MKERRRYTRSILPQRAIFFGLNGWEDCIITESSKRGLGIEFYTKKKINDGSIINLKVLVPTEPKPIMVKGILKWTKKKGEYFIGGMEWLSIDRGSR